MFRDTIVEMVLNRLNLCCTELMQLEERDVNIHDKTSLIKKILEKISSGAIVSPHLNREKAKSALLLIEYMSKNVITMHDEHDKEILEFIGKIKDHNEFGGKNDTY